MSRGASRWMLSGQVIRRALMVAVVVGSILNLLNQWDCFFGGRPLDWLRFLANFAVPFSVSLYSGWRAHAD